MVATVGGQKRPDTVVVIRGDAHALRGFQLECGVADITDLDLAGPERGLPYARLTGQEVPVRGVGNQLANGKGRLCRRQQERQADE
ncbi:hypothetical protein QW131_01510 [Roseibium salinum]|nr:hypothetical protein [Roseibium salinum]